MVPGPPWSFAACLCRSGRAVRPRARRGGEPAPVGSGPDFRVSDFCFPGSGRRGSGRRSSGVRLSGGRVPAGGVPGSGFPVGGVPGSGFPAAGFRPAEFRGPAFRSAEFRWREVQRPAGTPAATVPAAGVPVGRVRSAGSVYRPSFCRLSFCRLFVSLQALPEHAPRSRPLCPHAIRTAPGRLSTGPVRKSRSRDTEVAKDDRAGARSAERQGSGGRGSWRTGCGWSSPRIRCCSGRG